ncbi:MAG: DUF6259 domain-containing protein, partial [Syntrophothermus sp.]
CLNTQNEKVALLPKVTYRAEATGSRIEVAYSSLWDGEREVDITAEYSIELRGDDPETFWRLRLANHTRNLRIVEVVFPYLQGIWLGQSHRDDVIVYPHHAGERTVNPAEEYATERYLTFGRAGSVKEAAGHYSREINYCGLASMMWLDYYEGYEGVKGVGSRRESASHGLYLASYDPDFLLTGIRAEAGGPEDPWMGFAFRKYLKIDPGQSWESHPYAVGIHPGDWHWGARRYRRWIEQHITYPEVPRDLKEQAGMAPRYDFRNYPGIQHRFEEIPAMFEEGQAMGLEHFFIAGWNRRGFDNNYPEYYPDMELGTAEDLAAGCRYINEHGGMVTFYINARIFDVESDYYPTLGVEWALKDEKGRQFQEVYEPKTFAVMCPAYVGWQKWIIDYATWMVRCFGARGIYLDQVGSAEPHVCYDQAHRHPHHGMFNHGYLEILRTVKERIQKINPRAFLMIENCGDIYGSYVFGNLTWNGTLYDEFFNMYKYTFPRYIQVNMVNPRRIGDRPTREAYFYSDLERAMLLGSVFWAEIGDRFPPEDADLKAYFRRALDFRKRLAPYFAEGTFVDDEGICVMDNEGLLSRDLAATHWLLQRGAGTTHFVVAANRRRRKGREILLEVDPARVLAARSISLDGEWRDARFRVASHAVAAVTSPGISLAVPEADFVAFLVEEEQVGCGQK